MKRIEIALPASLDNLKLVERPIRRPGAGELLVKVQANSLNFHDALVVRGILTSAAGRVPLSDGAGEVVETGADVSEFKAGDRVTGTFFANWAEGPATLERIAQMRGEHVDGFASEYVTLPANQFTHTPASLTDTQAATLPCAALTAWRALRVAGPVQPGETVLVKGSGGVSIFALQFARLLGAQVIVLTSSAKKAEKLRHLGASHVINYREVPAWDNLVRQLSNGVGVDHVVDVVGGDLTQTLKAMRVNAHLSLIGGLSRQPIQFPTFAAVTGNIRMSAITVGSREHQVEMMRIIEQTQLQPVLDRHFELPALGDAFRYMETQLHFGKIVITR
ncbi:NAD(P)-dependent alcohol dehydrogenase [Pseudomonas kielensis]|uniref:zinc-dependent alcohol dehydrogenase family protein n=1 Tax=Pseudomonas kielensis TaxID=2762577 RepID=UPI0038A50C36